MDTKIYGKGSNENIYKLTKLSDIVKAFEELDIEEQRVNGQLEELLESQALLEAKMQSLNSVIPNLLLVENDSKQLSGMISFTSTLADNVSSKVRQLDLTKSRVELCKQRVEDILDLKSCTDGVQTALQDEDYEKAAAHVNRFLNLDEDILRMSADANEGSTLDASFKLLHEAQMKLKSIIHNKFDSAVMSGDAASVERFFKTFPLVGESQGGLAKFSKYLCSQLSGSTEKEITKILSVGPSDKTTHVMFARASTTLFEDVARLVEVHQPLVETYYGYGFMLTMIQHMQRECDRQVRNIVGQFKKARDIDRKLQVIQQSSFPQRGGVIEKIDPKDVDILLSETSIIGEKAELYMRFLRRRIFSDVDAAHQDEGMKKEKKAEAENFLNTCELSCYIQEFIGHYISMEEYYMKQMVAKAISIDTVEKGSLTSSMVDDTFYVVKKCIGRAMSSLSVDGVCAMLNHACTVLEQDFREVLFARLRQGYVSGFDLVQAYNLVQSTIVGGRLQAADVEGEKLRAMFLTTLNNSELSCENLHTLKSTIENKLDNLFSQSSEQARAKLQSCLSDLAEVSGKFREVTTFGLNQLVASAVRPRLKPSVDSFLSVSHDITEEEFSNYDVNDPWVQNLICQIDNLLASFKNTLTPGNYDQLVGHLSSEITTMLEKVLMKSTFNKIGGMQFDKEIRTLVSYLTNVTTWTVRDKFARLNQMATILSLDRVSGILDYWGGNSGPLTWRLTPTEARMVLNLRYDFKSDDIKKLKL